MWYREAIKSPKLSNPVVGGFWVNKEKKNEIGEVFIESIKFIDYGEPLYKGKLARLLETSTKNIDTQEKLNSFLSNPERFEIVDGKKIYVKTNKGNTTPIPNQIGEFYVGNEKIEQGKTFTITGWEKLLQTQRKYVNTQEKLNSFLSIPERFEIVDGKKIFIKKPYFQNRKLLVPFDFYVNDQKQKIQKDIPYGVKELEILLQTSSRNINKQEKLDSFLSNPERFTYLDGKTIYAPDPKHIKKPLYNQIGEFYVGNKKIEQGEVFLQGKLARLLQTSTKNIDTQEKFNSFLSNPERFEIVDGKKIYVPNTINKSKNIENIFGEFYVENKKIEQGETHSAYDWVKIFRTNNERINSQENFNLFLNNSDFIIDENNNKHYRPYTGSLRERYFNKNLILSANHNIQVIPQKNIIISNPGKSLRILKLDFALMRDEKILIAIEINGGQHYGFILFSKDKTYEDWQNALKRDIEKINYCHNNNIPLLIFHHLLPEKYFRTIIDNLNKNPNAYAGYIPQPVIDNNTTNSSLEFIRRQIYSHLYPVFNNVISFENDESKKRYIKDTLILISKLMGIYDDGIDKTDYIRAFDRNVDLTKNYNICLDIYNILYPDFPLDRDEKITYSDLSSKKRIMKEKPPIVKKPQETNLVPTEEFKDKDNVV